MLELLLIAALQFNALFIGVDAAQTETGGNGWGDDHTTTSPPPQPPVTGEPPVSYETGGNGWGDDH